MDASVIRAMARWPDVPEVRGWLALDRRGRWLLRGEPIQHPGLIAFIGRNYGHDEEGRWFFQNGPQRVYVSLAYTPWIYHFAGEAILTHTGEETRDLTRTWLDEDTNLLLATERGAGLLRDDQLLEAWAFMENERGEPVTDEDLADQAGSCFFALRETRLPLEPIRKAAVPKKLGFVPDP